MTAKSIGGKSTAEIASALQEQLADGFRPTLAIVFLSVSQNRKEIVQLLDEKGIQVFGVTSNGEFTDETPQSKSVAVLLMDMKPAHFRICYSSYGENNYQQSATTLARAVLDIFSEPAFLIAGSDSNTDAEALLKGFVEVVGEQVEVYGGMAGDDISFTEQFVFTNEWESNKGMIVLALDSNRVRIRGKATCGWKAVGTVKTVTRSERNHVYTVDNVPVLDLTARYGGIENLSPDNSQLLLEIAANLPMQLQRENGDPVMRPGLVIDWSDHSFYCSGNVPQGSKVRFSLPPDFDVIDKVVQATQALKEKEMPEADAVVVFSCAGRLLSFGPMINQELEGIKNVWKVPMAGMFSNAELARATGGNLEMHNATTCVVALKED
ncbi:MAG TPA: FIST N-terminal domain-containing protein [Chitinophagaceae bacterium]|jgi:hypothetical protein|nr:FIST N-terminal domain-containing protein [Chitinophagaceae bacterium]